MEELREIRGARRLLMTETSRAYACYWQGRAACWRVVFRDSDNASSRANAAARVRECLQQVSHYLSMGK
jgi:uncharacterized protein (DUF427 family)